MITDPELKLLVDLCASAIGSEQFEGASKSANWARLVRLARRHRVQGLAWLGLTGGVGCDLAQAAELRDDAMSIAQHNLSAIAASAELLEAFKNQGLALVFVKGLTLGALAYPQAMLKMSTDIDLLVDPKDIDPAEQCLARLGYALDGKSRSESRRSAASKEWPWVRKDGVVVDLHTRLADNPALLRTISARSRTQDVEVSPGIVLPTLRREDLLIYLCVHGTSSAWFRLKWLADLAALLNRCSADEIRGLSDTGRSHDAGRCADVALLVLGELFGPQIPSDLLTSASRDPITRLLASLSLRELSQVWEPLDRPLGTGLIHLSQLFVDRGFAFPFREFGRQFSNLAG